MPVPFGELLSDLPALNNPGATIARNCIPGAASYGPFKDLTAYSSALAARCQGAAAFRSSAGTIFTFAGTAGKLYMLSGTSWVDATRTAGGDYNVGADAFVSFTQFGDLAIATNGSDAPQKFDMSSATDFAALGGSPPTAKYVAVVRNFVVLANLTGFPQRVRWSAFEHAEDWTVDPDTQADFQDLLGDHGDITGIVGGDVGYIFFERAIFRMDYVGSPEIFRFSRVEQARGCTAPASIVALGAVAYYLSDDGFYRFDGQVSVPIGKFKIDKTLANELDQNYIYRINAALDPVNANVMWTVPVAGNNGGNPNKVYLYNWAVNRWSTVDINVEWFWRDLSKGYTLDTLDSLSASLDALPFSLDSRAYAGGKILFAAFNSSHQLGYFDGSNLEATLETGEAELTAGLRSLLTGIRPLVDGGTLTAAIGYRDRVNDSVTWSSDVSQGTDGLCPFLIDARYFRARVGVAAGGTWTHAIGIDFEAVPAGGM